jgi:hypothetical protein
VACAPIWSRKLPSFEVAVFAYSQRCYGHSSYASHAAFGPGRVLARPPAEETAACLFLFRSVPASEHESLRGVASGLLPATPSSLHIPPPQFRGCPVAKQDSFILGSLQALVAWLSLYELYVSSSDQLFPCRDASRGCGVSLGDCCVIVFLSVLICASEHMRIVEVWPRVFFLPRHLICMFLLASPQDRQLWSRFCQGESPRAVLFLPPS